MTTLYSHIIARFVMNPANLRKWEGSGLPSRWIKVLALQGKLHLHEGAWVLEWDGEEFPITDDLAGLIRTGQQLQASKKTKTI